ncbi:MAG: LLM class flavin-dependent oxidoreductase [Dehalococcoidia bacterium]|nr:LLM class flavin-dependent oxidoreductase [Dehalococcoidia bacterium]
MKFGVFYEHSVLKPWDERSEYRVYHQAVEQVVAAEEAGFDQVWEVEHHFLEEYSHSPAPEVFLSFCAAKTSRIRLGHGIALMLPPVNHPARVAERAAALDILSDGRLEFGTGRSATWTELGAFGCEPDVTKEMWDECTRAVVRMWTSSDAGWDGKHFKMPPRNVVPKPLQKPHPPLWVAVQSPETAVQAGERGMGMLGVTLGAPLDYQQMVKDYHRAIRTCESVGEAVNEQVNGVSFMFCGEDDAEAKALGGMAAMQFGVRAAHLVGVGGIYPSPAYHAHSSAAPLRNRPGDVVGPVREGTPVGDPHECIKQLKWWEEVGVDRMCFLVNTGETIPQEKVLESLRLFGREVIPALTVRERAEAAKAAEAAKKDELARREAGLPMPA